ncbi:DEAD/DEAH box helicase [Thermosphaera chiliense]|uniref:DEAD/DEAH box helicase n=2 Tax=Thermosphaera chiliense TaxID=3402707 RepID=A0A7M1US15_9CREN|nr:DEAD/DEAH box helicase [Thermosphaera aggregans]
MPGKIAECLKSLGYERFTELQRRSFESIALRNSSTLIVAPTGSGKTEAAVIPVMYSILKQGLKPIACIYITPLRALNRDIEKRLKKLAECFGLEISLKHGDTPETVRKAILENPPHILVTTPENFNYIMVNEKLAPSLANLRFIVFDEFHELLESKRGLLAFTTSFLLEKKLGRRLVKIALSATLSNPERAGEILAWGEKPSLVEDSTVKKMSITVEVPECNSDLCFQVKNIIGDEKQAARIARIIELVEKHAGVLIFVNTRSLAERLGSLLKTIPEKLGLPGLRVEVHHGSLSRSHRESVESSFKKREVKALVSTSSMELGIDVGHVDLVIQYLSPRQATRLTQRVGRSGHRLTGESKGVVLSMDNTIHFLESLVLAKRTVEKAIEKEEIIYSPLDVLAYAMAVESLLFKEGFSKEGFYTEIKQHPLYKDLTTEEYEKLVDYMVYTRILREEAGILRHTRKTRIYLYKTSMIPSSRDVMVVEAASNRRIGSLNEEYVVLNVNPGDTIIIGGNAWRVVGYDDAEAKLYVEKTAASIEEALIPHWEGENIPVEYDVAEEVGRLITYLKTHGEIPGDYAASAPGRTRVEVAEDLCGWEKICVDYVEELRSVLVTVYGGSKVNNLLREILATVLKNRLPHVDVESYSSPYTLVLRIKGYHTPREVTGIVQEALARLGSYLDRDFLKQVARNGKALYWRIFQVGQRFGAITPGETRVSKTMLEAFVDTVIGDEAFREVLVKDYDIDSAAELAERIARGDVRVEARYFEKLGQGHLELLGYIEIPVASSIITLDREQYAERLFNRRARLLCIRCGYEVSGTVRELAKMEKYVCPKCKTATLALVKTDGEEEKKVIAKARRGERLTSSEQALLEDLAKRAIILYKHGKTALLALSARGVGASEAARILSKVSSGGDLLSEIYESEKKYLKAKKYIDAKKQS